ncbi:oligogalacturonate lyase family protein [Sphingomonas sp. PB2P19]|uniref:oligogalacturonate lyase family protein n=1 Tax=Sphingomonas rhamnosi TaxID=3096156 RepID=UPI002FC9DF33
MRSIAWLAVPLAIVAAAPAVAADRTDWVDAKTGHRVHLISDAPGNYALYFNYNAYTPNGDTMVFQTKAGISRLDMKSWKVTSLLSRRGAHVLFVGHKTRSVYFSEQAGGAADAAITIYAADIDSGAVRLIAKVPKGSRIDTINADETLLAGQIAERDMPLQPGAGVPDTKTGQAAYAANWPDGTPMTYADAKEFRLNQRLDARVPMEIFTLNVKTGERRSVLKATDWLNHLQFSPTDPTLLMYCHEGPWHKVDRIWTIRTDGSQMTKVHARTMNMEIAGHEFWSPDGKTIWYDLQRPRGESFWLAGYEVATGKRTQYHLERNQWSVHYNLSADQTRFVGDGGDSEMVAHAPDGKWLYLFTPKTIPDVAGIHAADAASLIVSGKMDQEKIVDFGRQNYQLEPNARFSPDGKWLIFRANIEGKVAIYAAEVAKAAQGLTPVAPRS